MAPAMAMDVGSITKVAAWAGRRIGGAAESILGMVVPLMALIGCILAGYLVLGRWLSSSMPWMVKAVKAFRSPRPRDLNAPAISVDDLYDKTCEVDFQVKELGTKMREVVLADALDGAVSTIMRRLEATLAQENAKSMKDTGKKESEEVLASIQDKFDKVLKEVQLSLVETQKITTQSTQPIKRSQESFATALNEKATEILKELSNVFHRVKKESGDLMAMVRWTGSKVEQVETLCAHQPERLQILRDTLLEVQTTVVRIQTEMEAAQEGDGAASPPQRQEWAQPQPQPASSTAPPTTPATPHTINLDETVPVQLMRPSSSPLTSLALADGRVIYVPRQVVSSLFGAQF
ncbi:pol [Symbiodinium necroappetens]|uniref:Pol protein n=1 Tax=Symbiodinium necroappetens TaxID=1628268 RepID=A0A812IV96_9DINO|nr:pol [Symbiodinium necroappetens]